MLLPLNPINKIIRKLEATIFPVDVKKLCRNLKLTTTNPFYEVTDWYANFIVLCKGGRKELKRVDGGG